MGNVVKTRRVLTGGGDSSGGGGNTLQATGTISSAEIKNGVGNYVMKTLIAAPGVGNYLWIKRILFKYNYNTIAYDFVSVGIDSYITYSSVGLTTYYLANIPTVNGVLDAANDVQWNFSILPSSVTSTFVSLENKALQFERDNANPPTVGNGTIDYVIDYEIIAV